MDIYDLDFSYSEEEFQYEEDLTFEDLSKKDRTLFMRVSIDTEFTESHILSLQICCSFVFNDVHYDFKIMVINSAYKSYVQNETSIFLDPYLKDIYFFYNDFEDDEEILFFYYIFQVVIYKLRIFTLDSLQDSNILIFLYFYYSIKDLRVALGWDNLKKLILKNTFKKQSSKTYFTKKDKSFISQKRSILGCYSDSYLFRRKKINFNIIFKDLFGLSNQGLLSLIEATGLGGRFSDVKKSMDFFKTQMDYGLRLKTKEFIIYAMADTDVLLKIVDSKIQSFNDLLINVYGIEDSEYHFDIFNFPMTLGRLVHEIWKRYLFHNIFKANSIYRLAYCKGAILNQSYPDYNTALESFNFLSSNNFSSLNDLQTFMQESPLEYQNLYENLLAFQSIFKFYPDQYSSIKYLMENSLSTNLFLTSIPGGGRTVNERPFECFEEYAGDIDISGAYASQLNMIHYPIGRSRFICMSPNQESFMLLGDFMSSNFKKFKKYKLLKLIVSGNLTFCQDLIFSRIISTKTSLTKTLKYNYLDLNELVVPSSFVLLRKEIINGLITYDIWDLIQKVGSNLEKSEFNNLKIHSAIFHYDEDCVTDIEDYLNYLLKDQGKYFFSFDTQSVLDTRTYKTFVVPLNNFISPLIEQRKKVKKSNLPRDMALSWAYKTTINTFWGDLTSVFFKNNNVICSELVTSGIRTMVWMMSKPLNSLLSITDGDPYPLMKVNYLKSTHSFFKKPSFNALSSDYFFFFGKEKEVIHINNES